VEDPQAPEVAAQRRMAQRAWRERQRARKAGQQQWRERLHARKPHRWRPKRGKRAAADGAQAVADGQKAARLGSGLLRWPAE
jgi:hypothetical protein